MDNNQKFRLISQVIDGIFATAKVLLVVGGIVIIGYYFRDVLLAYAGKETNASISFSLITKLQADKWFAYLFGAGGIGYGVVQRRLRRRNIRRLTTDKTRAENQLHAGRTSSGLTPDGRTPPEDR